jgi:hypothetical protein
MAENPSEKARRQLFAVLYDKVSEDKYPSPTMLDVLERLMTPDDIETYAELLLSKIRDETYPSMSMVRRVIDLA